MSRKRTNPVTYSISDKYGFKGVISTNNTDEETNVAFLRVKARIIPRTEKKNYLQEILFIRKTLTDHIIKCIKSNDNYTNRYMVEVSLPQMLYYNEISFIHYEAFVTSAENQTLKAHKEHLSHIFKQTNEKLREILKTFDFEVIFIKKDNTKKQSDNE